MGDAPIGVFDSGIGGLTVLKELLAHLPGEAFVYFGDTARVPYGTKSAETVRRFSRENVRLLLDRGVKSVVVACNTASAEALPMLQREFALPIVGVIEPGVRAAVTASGSGKIGVIGTAGTIRSGAYQAGIRLLKENADITAAPCPLFVPLAEEGWIDHPVTEMVAREYLNEFRTRDIDALVLGCTHYPLLKSVISRVMGASVELVDSAVETAREMKRIIQSEDIIGGGGNGNFSVILSDTSPTFEEIAQRFLGRDIPEIELVSV
ncbi:MAG: glutamate racemase [Candidatus Krumholzibacteria bacterium]|nr:glutamate racemase [Candidatus Krumholzibacteria bacterium]